MNIFARIRSALAARYAAADKSVLTNLAFLSAIALTTILLVGFISVTWWSDNLAPGVEVNGSSITVGEARSRGDIESFRLTLQAERIRARVSAGTMDAATGDALLQQINDKGTNLSNQITSDLIDSILIKDLAATRGVVLDQAAADAAWEKEITIPELRLLRSITIPIENAAGTTAPNAATEAAAQKRADSILAQLRSGADFISLAKAESSDPLAVDGGRIGWSAQSDDPMSDPAYVAAWGLTASGFTEVIKEPTDEFVIFMVDQIRPATKDEGFDQLVSDAKINVDLYKRMIAEETVTEALNKVVTAELLVSPVEQRDVSYVTSPLPATDGSDVEEVLVRHILYSPKDDTKNAAKLPPDDPAWAAAEAEANAAFAKIQAGTPMKDLATESDDTGSIKKGGLLGWAAKGSYVTAFEDAVWADGLTPGDLLGPIKTEFGYHVIQFEGRRESLTLRMGTLATDLATAGDGYDARIEQAKLEIDGLQSGEAGFVSRYSINPDLAAPAWELAAGAVSPVISLPDRLLIVRVKAIENRDLTPDQIRGIEASGFWSWLAVYRSSASIKIQGQVAQEAGATPAP